MNKKVFISYSRKDSLDVAEFRSIDTFREFEILIDDEEIEFNKPWKQNIRNKINNSHGAILFISKNTLNPKSPIRTLELPLISKRYSDPDDNFNFFPIFLEDIDAEIIKNYTFTPSGTEKEVNFLDQYKNTDRPTLIPKHHQFNLLDNEQKLPFDIDEVLEPSFLGLVNLS